MDVVYLYKHSIHQDEEIQFSMRSVQAYLPYIRKVWVMGDKPKWLSSNQDVVEHIPYEYIARVGRYKIPVRNQLLQLFLTSVHPGVDFEFLMFCDDFVMVDYVPESEIRKLRVLSNMARVKTREKGRWIESLWRTYDELRRRGYPGYNFEAHIPSYYNKKWIFDAFFEFEEIISEDRFYGMLAASTVYNYIMRHHPQPLISVTEEGRRLAIYRKPPEADEFQKKILGKWFLNFDDGSYPGPIKDFLMQRFPVKCLYEQ